ncbi:unnamed protein product, partial [Heterotrigona itama]
DCFSLDQLIGYKNSYFNLNENIYSSIFFICTIFICRIMVLIGTLIRI